MATPFKGTKAETDALNAYIKLMRAAESVTTRAHTVLPRDITLSQFGVLEVLLHCGPLCQSDLAGKLLKSGGNITLIVDNLEKAGHVGRERSSEDRRFVTVSLTDSGRAFITELFPKVAASITRELGSLSTAEQFTLGWLCKKAGLGVPAPAA
ncbi:MAG: MarR family transcriptional regulator [Verrucomicrobiota bacterium]|jgi:MarR family transcriptional regulator, 2-MHQ and catechol-resistance regulon repressor